MRTIGFARFGRVGWFAPLTLTALVFVDCAVCRDKGTDEEVEAPRPWRELASERLHPDAIERLEANGMIVVDEKLSQVFHAYIENGLPFFITSDAALHGYHILLEESLIRMEYANAVNLRLGFEAALREMAKVEKLIEGDRTPAFEQGRKRALFTLAVACRLLGGDTGDLGAETEKLVAEEIARIRSAREKELPDWLADVGFGIVGIDYERCSPVGSYSNDRVLGGYFRAVRWLQMIPFESSRDEDWLALCLISASLFPVDIDGVTQEADRLLGAVDSSSSLFGIADGLGILNFHQWHNVEDWVMTTQHQNNTVADLLDRREDLSRNVEETSQYRPLINDILRLPRQEEANNEANIEFRILPGKRLPEAALFAQTVGGPGFEKRIQPDGLELAAWVKSPFAIQQLETRKESDVLQRGANLLDLRKRGNSVYSAWLNCMETLATGIDPTAPPIFTGEAWNRKTCETLLASWAHMRRSASLQAKINVSYFGAFRTPVGFIEPNPDFFSDLAWLCRKTALGFENVGAFRINPAVQAEEYRQIAEILVESSSSMTFVEDLAESDPLSSPPAEGEKLDPRKEIMNYRNMPVLKVEEASEILRQAKLEDAKWDNLDGPEHVAAIGRALAELADTVQSGARPPIDEEFPATLSQNWDELEKACRRLESLCHKQLRGMEFSDSESYWLRNIGALLGGIEFYSGNSWLTPRDDAPRVAEVLHDPRNESHFHVATGRPLAIYLLYPWKGEKRLCRGAVMTYYEPVARKPLDDFDWRELLDGADPPSRPGWCEPAQPPSVQARSPGPN